MLADIIPKIAEMEQKESGIWYPRASNSGIERCIRQSVYHGLNYPAKPFPGRTIMVFEAGHEHEKMSAFWISKSAYTLHSKDMPFDVLDLSFEVPSHYCKMCEKVIPAQNKIHIHPDGILQDFIGSEMAYEAKGINHFSFHRYAKDDNPLDYLTQLSMAIVGLQQYYPKIKRGLLFIKNKNTEQLLEFLVEVQEDGEVLILRRQDSMGGLSRKVVSVGYLLRDAVERFEQIHLHILRKEIPERQYYLTDWQCELCRYGELCWAGYEEEFQSLTEDAQLDQEVEELCGQYQSIKGQRQDSEKEEKKLKRAIFDIMKAAKAKGGYAGKYFVEIIRQERKSYTAPASVFEYPKVKLRKDDNGKI